MRYFLLSIITLMTLVACEDNDNESNVEPQKPQVEIKYSAEERQALIDLYNATNGPNWSRNNTNWCTEEPLSKWAGVQCDSGRVVGLSLFLSNLNGTIPQSFGNLKHLKNLVLSNNYLRGPIPTSVMNSPWWNRLWHKFLPQRDNGIAESELVIHAPKFSCTDANGQMVDNSIFGRYKYTIFYCGKPNTSEMTIFRSLYLAYKEQIGFVVNIKGASPSECKDFADQSPIPMTVIATSKSSDLNPYPNNKVSVFDQSGIMIFNPYFHSSVDLFDLFGERIGPIEEYIDYSQDGVVEKLQSAEEGNGINIILMGDAYTDWMIAEGLYDQTMRGTMDKLFTVEPYKSLRQLFNVYSVKVVSKCGGYFAGAETALECTFGSETHVGGNKSKVLSYASKVLNEEQMDEAVIVVIMNSTQYAGTCYYYYPSGALADYSRGLTISYVPLGANEAEMERTLHHEACGHGFAKLADEYVNESEVADHSRYMAQHYQYNYGWYKNIDFTGDPKLIRWAKFIADPRYADEKIGAYEGAYYRRTGAWRSRETSIMVHNTGGFNAPSREAIYYRAHKLAYGAEWQYDYEEFVEWDTPNRTASTTTRSSTPMIYAPTATPIIINKDWRDELKK